MNMIPWQHQEWVIMQIRVLCKRIKLQVLSFFELHTEPTKLVTGKTTEILTEWKL